MQFIDPAAFADAVHAPGVTVRAAAHALDEALNAWTDRSSEGSVWMASFMDLRAYAAAQETFRRAPRAVFKLTHLPKVGPRAIAIELELRTSELGMAPLVTVALPSTASHAAVCAEMPLQALVLRRPAEGHRYAVWCHALVDSEETRWLYHSMSRAGWDASFVARLLERRHRGAKAALIQKAAELVENRKHWMQGLQPPSASLHQVISMLCGFGLSKERAEALEEYLVDQRSLSAVHPTGLNRFPGGRRGQWLVRQRPVTINADAAGR